MTAWHDSLYGFDLDVGGNTVNVRAPPAPQAGADLDGDRALACRASAWGAAHTCACAWCWAWPDAVRLKVRWSGSSRLAARAAHHARRPPNRIGPRWWRASCTSSNARARPHPRRRARGAAVRDRACGVACEVSLVRSGWMCCQPALRAPTIPAIFPPASTVGFGQITKGGKVWRAPTCWRTTACAATGRPAGRVREHLAQNRWYAGTSLRAGTGRRAAHLVDQHAQPAAAALPARGTGAAPAMTPRPCTRAATRWSWRRWWTA